MNNPAPATNIPAPAVTTAPAVNSAPTLNSTSPIVHCLFYTHPWSIDALRNAKLCDMNRTLLIELSQRSQLASLIDAQHQLRPGVTGILRDPDRLDELITLAPRFPLPVILAPNPPVADATMISAVALLPSVRSNFNRFMVFIHLSEALNFRYAYPYCDRFSFLWDVADPPMYKMGELGAMLRDLGVLKRESWGGFLWFNHPRRHVNNLEARLSELRRVMGQAKKTPSLGSTT
jgi:hypothetical protein